jgi:hypothetical protein
VVAVAHVGTIGSTTALFRYLLESASAECKRWTYPAYGEIRPIKIMFSRRKEISYPQTRAYLYKLKTERRDRSYFNNKNQIDWSIVDIPGIEGRKDKEEIGLQIADCAASGIYRSLDESWFGNATPKYLEFLSKRFIRIDTTPWDYGFKLLPDNFGARLSEDQRQGLISVGYRS